IFIPIKSSENKLYILFTEVNISSWGIDTIKKIIWQIFFVIIIFLISILKFLFKIFNLQVKKVELVIILFFGIIFSFFVGYLMISEQIKQDEKQFIKISELKTTIILDILLSIERYKIVSLTGLFESSEIVEKHEFEKFASKLLKDFTVDNYAYYEEDKDYYLLKYISGSNQKVKLPSRFDVKLIDSLGYAFNKGNQVIELFYENGQSIILKRIDKTFNEKRGFIAAQVNYKEIIKYAIKTGSVLEIADINIYKLNERNLLLLASEKLTTIKNTEIGFDNFFSRRNFWVPAFCFGEVYIIEANRKNNYNFIYSYIIISFGLILSFLLYTFLNFLETRKETLEKEVEIRTKELHENRALLLSIFNSAPICIGVVGDGKFVEINQSMERITGFSKKEIVGSDLRFLYSEEEFNRVNAIFSEAFQTNKTGYIETQWRTKDGVEIPMLLSISVIGEFSGKKEYIFTATDITQVKLAEQKLKETIEIMKKVDASKMNFLNMISHELKTPLTIIKGYFNLLKKEILDTVKQKDYIFFIENNLKRLMNLMNELIDIIRLDADKYSIEKSKCDLNEIIVSSVQQMKIFLDEKNIKVNFGGLENAYIFADHFRISQVVINLLNNAIKFSGKNSNIYIHIEKNNIGYIKDNKNIDIGDLKEGQYYMVSIKDEGIGISPENLEKIFDKFYQINEKDFKEQSGFGLGLYICKNIIERHGGKIWAKSEGLGKGAEFIFVLPAD
ncbi:MAG: PAS domain-containing sensor histidine kinase, partial [Candidatus Goldbacteria bacterium]|nr:PAS domain-containing sensor histidine kinase [Candidatus Goldiibacteriota bacterium]